MDTSGFNRWRPLIPLVLAVVLIPLLTSGKPAIPPVAWVSVGVMVLVAARTLLAGESKSPLDYLLTLVLGVAATHLLFAPGFPNGHDIITHLWGTYGFNRAILEGNLWPRWVHELGLGMPLFLFYPPLPFYFTLPFTVPFMPDGLPTYDGFKYSFVVFNALSGASMFFVVNRWTGSRRAALVASVAYCFAPYHLCESNFRVAIAEAFAMISLPPFFYYMARALEKPIPVRVRWASFWTALLALSHPLTLSMAGTAMGLYVLVSERWASAEDSATTAGPTAGITPASPGLPKRLGLLLALGIAGVALAGFYTVPIAVEGRHATISNSLGGKMPMYSQHGLYPTDLLQRRAWSKWQKSERHGDPERKNEMPFYFGITLLALIPLGLLPSRKLSASPYVQKGMVGVAAGSLLLTLYPFDLLGYLPNLIILQFPWRFLSPATCGAAILAGFATAGLLEHYQKETWGRFIPAAIVALMLFDFMPYGGAPLWQKPYTGLFRWAEKRTPGDLPLRVDMLNYPPADPRLSLSTFRRAYPEYFTPATKANFQRSKDVERLEYASIGLDFDKAAANPKKLKPQPYAQFIPADGTPSRPLLFTRGGEKITAELPGVAGTLVIKEQYFPGWEASLGNRHIPVTPDADGLMRFTLDAEMKGTLSLWFSRTTWDRSFGIILSLFMLVLLFRPRSQTPNASPSGASPRSASPVEPSAANPSELSAQSLDEGQELTRPERLPPV